MSARDRSLIAVIVLVIVAVGGYFLLVKPEHHKADQLQTQITSAQSQLQQAEASVLAGETAESQYKTYAGQLKAVRAAVPSDEQIPELINELQTASTKDKLGFQAVSASGSTSGTTAATTTPTTAAAPFPSQSFSLSFTGSYFAVARLLGTLDSFVRADDKHFKATGRLISISTVTLSPGDSSASSSAQNSAGSGNVTAAVTALDYDIPTALLGGTTTTPTTGG